MRKLLLAGIMTLALPVAAFAQTSGTADQTAGVTTQHKAAHHTAHRRSSHRTTRHHARATRHHSRGHRTHHRSATSATSSSQMN